MRTFLMVSLVALAACATTTRIASEPPGATAIVANRTLGATPVNYESKMWAWETETLTVKAPGYKTRTVELKRTEVDTLPMVGSVCLCMAPIVWPAGALTCAAGGWKLPAATTVKLERDTAAPPPPPIGPPPATLPY